MNKCLPKHIGARNELIACSWLLNQGYEVFRNVSQHGEIDLIAKKGNEIVYLDVKATHTSKTGYTISLTRLTQAQFDLGVKRLNVFPDGTCAIVHEPTAIPKIACEICGKTVPRRSSLQKFCSKSCNTAHWNKKYIPSKTQNHRE